MELFNGDRLLQDDGAGVVFPDQLCPFPDLLYHPHGLPLPASARSRDDEEGEMNGNPLHCHNLPPQKLRPVRYTGRSPSDSQFPIPGALSGYRHCPDVEFFGGPVEFGCRGEESGKQPSRDSDGRVEELELSQSTPSSSDGGDESFTIIRELENRKRKRRSESKLHVGLMEALVVQLMERQEQMHKELMETIESRERERISREEAWQRVVIEKMKRNEELRNQETSRSLALISYIHKMLGQDFPKPEPLSIVRPEERQGESPPNKDVDCDSGNQRWLEDEVEALISLRTALDHKDADCDSVNKRWPEGEVQALISLRTALDHKFHATGCKGLVWEEISISMSSMGYKRSANKCKEKWENINKYFKRRRRKQLPEDGKTRRYFQELDILYKAGLLNSGKDPDGPNRNGVPELATTRELQSSLDSSDRINNLKDFEGQKEGDLL